MSRSTFSGPVYSIGGFEASAAISATGDLSVTGAITQTGNMSVTGTIGVTGSIYNSGVLTNGGAANIVGQLNVGGDVVATGGYYYGSTGCLVLAAATISVGATACVYNFGNTIVAAYAQLRDLTIDATSAAFGSITWNGSLVTLTPYNASAAAPATNATWELFAIVAK